MIQRIQSLLMLLAAIITIVLLFIPVGNIYTADFQYVFTCFNLKYVAPAEGFYLSTIYIALILIVSAVISIVSIFMYKDRMKQTRVISFNMLLFCIAIILMTWIYPEYIFVNKGIIADNDFFMFNYWIMIFIFPPILMFFANRAIRKDEKKVRAADRLR